MKRHITPFTEAEKKAVIYLRVSSEEQVENFSLDTQEGICRKEAEKRGYEVVELFREEGRSAKDIVGRPVLINLLEYCRKNKGKVSAVFLYRLDRISRQTADYLAIRKKLAEQGVTIISATEPTGNTPTEKLVETMLAGFAQLDNDIRGERARNGLRARFLSGLVSGKPPLGYVLQAGFSVKDPLTWDKVKSAWDLMETGTKSLNEIAAIMNDWGLREIHKKKEYKLRSQTVQRIFRQKFYIGIISSRKYPDEVKGQHVPMISEQQFYKVQAFLDGRNNQKLSIIKRERSNEHFPLRRIVRCAKCGLGLTATWSKGHGGVYGYYRCSSMSRCNTKSIRLQEAEDALLALLKKITPKKECLDLYLYAMQKSYSERFKRLEKMKQEADDEIERLKVLRKTLVEKNLSGVYSDEVFKEQNAIIEEKMITAQIVKDDTLIEKYNIDAITSFLKTLLADLGETYKRSNVGQIKVLLGSIFPSGLEWRYDGTYNHKINTIYQSISDFRETGVPLGGGEGVRTLVSLAGSRFPGVCN